MKSDPETGVTLAPTRDPLLGSLSRVIDEVLRPLLAGGRPVALLDFPRTPNVGDSAIWLGAVAALARLGLRPVYTCDELTYSREALARRIGEGTILLSGGGNFGDLYPSHQRLRESVICDFPRNRIVQLPQTIRFESREAARRARDVFDAHTRVTLLVRDQRSLEFARDCFRAPSALCPDMALALATLPRIGHPSQPIVWLARSDRESLARTAVALPPGVRKDDWLDEGVTPGVRLSRRLRWLLEARPGLEPLFAGLAPRANLMLARERVRRGSRLLGAGRVVITDRLHGHILCLLLGIPHIVLDNSYGKVRGFYEAWTHASPLVAWAESESAAWTLAEEWAAERSSR